MAKTELTWHDVDTDNLPDDVDKAFKAFLSARNKANKTRETFYDALAFAFTDADVIPEGKTCVFSYKWGKLTAAFKDDDGKAKSKAGKGVNSTLAYSYLGLTIPCIASHCLMIVGMAHLVQSCKCWSWLRLIQTTPSNDWPTASMLARSMVIACSRCIMALILALPLR